MTVDNKRRNILKIGTASFITASTSYYLLRDNTQQVPQILTEQSTSQVDAVLNTSNTTHDTSVKDSINKVKNFNVTYVEDVFLATEKKMIFKNALRRINRVKKYIGFANFNLLSFDDMLLYANRSPKIGRFTKKELNLIDEIFFFDANKYGFHGEKVITELTSIINKKDTIKVPGSGHYLFQGEASTKFNQLKNDVGPNLILTSGVRSVVKQLQLFLSKLESSHGNLSLASRSLAPPGHSYHGIGDFDVGKKGFGGFNFTSKFSTTEEYKRLIELKYVDLRYTLDNQVGVRYEPWHIKVV